MLLNLIASTSYTIGIAYAGGSVTLTQSFTTPTRPTPPSANTQIFVGLGVGGQSAHKIAMNYDGTVIAIAHFDSANTNSYVSVSKNRGSTIFSTTNLIAASAKEWGLCMNYAGDFIFYMARGNNPNCYYTRDYGTTYTTVTNTGITAFINSESCFGLKCNYLGDKIYAITNSNNGTLYYSTNYGVTFTQLYTNLGGTANSNSINALPDFSKVYFQTGTKYGFLTSTSPTVFTINSNTVSVNGSSSNTMIGIDPSTNYLYYGNEQQSNTNQFFYSSPNYTSWTNITATFLSASYQIFSGCIIRTDCMYGMFYNNPNGYMGIYHTINKGTSWVQDASGGMDGNGMMNSYDGSTVVFANNTNIQRLY